MGRARDCQRMRDIVSGVAGKEDSHKEGISKGEKKAANEIIKELKEIHSIMDNALGDTDLNHFETDDIEKEEAPFQYCARRIMQLIKKQGV